MLRAAAARVTVYNWADLDTLSQHHPLSEKKIFNSVRGKDFLSYLGKPVSTKTDEFPENFRKLGGVISDPKNYIAIFFALEKAILVMNFREKPQKGGAVRKFSRNSSVFVSTGFPY